MTKSEKSFINTSKFIKKKLIPHVDYQVCRADPAIGILYIINNFISGHVRLLGRKGGRYPHKYLEMIDAVFGKAEHTIEVCSGSMQSNNELTTVDHYNPAADVIYDAQSLSILASNGFDRWRADPPYNEKTAKEMYGCEMPSIAKLLKAGSRVVKPGSLLFLLCNHNRQLCPPSLKRIGLITMTIVPLNEVRCLNIYVKLNQSL